MTKKTDVDLDTYRKADRYLAKEMEVSLREGGLQPILDEVLVDPTLQLDIRERRFNVYYGGGNLLLVDGRNNPWKLHFDANYFAGSSLEIPNLPKFFEMKADAKRWVDAFPELKAGMIDWWTRHPKGERAHCQAIAATNNENNGVPATDYLILDLEYEWGKRRFDLMAARRNVTDEDPTGWIEPILVFVEVKSDVGACTGQSGLSDHASDYRDIVLARNGRRTDDIKLEYQNIIRQKQRLGLLSDTLTFMRFAKTVPELLIVFVDVDPDIPAIAAPLTAVRSVAEALGDKGSIGTMLLTSDDYSMSR